MSTTSRSGGVRRRILSFVSPCVLPLIPGYISFISGVSLDEMRGGAAPRPRRRAAASSSLAVFVLGFSLVFIALGATASGVGKFLFAQAPLLEDRRRHPHRLRPAHDGRASGSAARARSASRRSASRRARWARFWSAIAFAFGWTPCIGPILGGILAIAGVEGHRAAKASQLLAVYSLGLGVPFLLTSVAINQFFAATEGSASTTTRSSSSRAGCWSSSAC